MGEKWVKSGWKVGGKWVEWVKGGWKVGGEWVESRWWKVGGILELTVEKTFEWCAEAWKQKIPLKSTRNIGVSAAFSLLLLRLSLPTQSIQPPFHP